MRKHFVTSAFRRNFRKCNENGYCYLNVFVCRQNFDHHFSLFVEIFTFYVVNERFSHLAILQSINSIVFFAFSSMQNRWTIGVHEIGFIHILNVWFLFQVYEMFETNQQCTYLFRSSRWNCCCYCFFCRSARQYNSFFSVCFKFFRIISVFDKYKHHMANTTYIMYYVWRSFSLSPCVCDQIDIFCGGGCCCYINIAHYSLSIVISQWTVCIIMFDLVFYFYLSSITHIHSLTYTKYRIKTGESIFCGGLRIIAIQ